MDLHLASGSLPSVLGLHHALVEPPVGHLGLLDLQRGDVVLEGYLHSLGVLFIQFPPVVQELQLTAVSLAESNVESDRVAFPDRHLLERSVGFDGTRLGR